MIFNSLTFVVFLLAVYVLYWALDRRRQNALLLAASYVFYGWWDWRFLSLILLSSTVDFSIGRALGRTDDPCRRRLLLGVSLVVDLGVLGFFKYFNFFADSLVRAADALGLTLDAPTLRIVLPVGISFYTFQSLSYTIDVYRRRCASHRSLIEFLAFVSFFPQLVAGPIERATNLLGQFARDRTFDREQAKDGVRQMLWGFFQKVVVADGLAQYVNTAYAAPDSSGSRLLLATVFFAFQIYCDFAGYSNIASGCARLFGFSLMRNFAYPYFSRSIAEFWQRWHISLSTWFRDYLYIPLGGSREGFARTVRNVLITFTVSGFWHGANWTFVVWGMLNGLYFLPTLWIRRRGGDRDRGRAEPRISDLPAILLTFILTLCAWVFFRSASLGQAMEVFLRIGTDLNLRILLAEGLKLKLIVAALVAAEWLQRRRRHPLDIAAWPMPLRWATYNAVALVILVFGTFKYTPFIYFQF